MRVLTTMDDEYSYAMHMTGTATTLHDDEPESEGDARVRALLEVVAEVTGSPVQAPAAKPRMGFF